MRNISADLLTRNDRMRNISADLLTRKDRMFPMTPIGQIKGNHIWLNPSAGNKISQVRMQQSFAY